MTPVTMGRLVDLIVAALLGATDAGGRVFTPGDWPTATSQLPQLRVQGLREHKIARSGRMTVEFDVTATIRITLRVDAPAAAADQGGQDAEDKVWALQRQVELAVINYPWIDADDHTPLLQQIPQVASQMAVNSQGELQLGEMTIDIDMEYYQGPEAFYPIPTAPLERVTSQVIEPDGTTRPGFDITFPA